MAQPGSARPVRGRTGLVDRPTPHNALAEILTPCLILAFEHDVDSPPRYARQASEAIANCAYREIAGAGHLGFLTHAGETAQHLVEFFDQE